MVASTEQTSARGRLSENDVRARILRMPAEIRSGIPGSVSALDARLPGDPSAEKLTIDASRTYLAAVTTLFRRAGVLRNGNNGPEGRAADVTWHLEQNGTSLTLEFEPAGDWASLGPADGAPGAHLEIWSDRLVEARADAAWVKSHEDRDAIRTRVIEEIRKLLQSFLEGSTDLATLRSTFDQRTRQEWDVFGLKGLSGAMFLNTLVKHVPDQAEMAVRLRAVLRVPEDDGRARGQMRAFSDFLEGLVEGGVVTRKMIQPSRAPFFVSAAWHMQDPDAWPVFYESAWRALESAGSYVPAADRVESYFRFLTAVRDVTAALGTRRWELEHLCTRGDQAGVTSTAGEDAPPKAGTGARVWLIAPGPNASLWDEFHRDGIVAIGWDDLGDLSRFQSLREVAEALRLNRGEGPAPTHDALACWEFATAMRVGDVVFAKKGRHVIVGHGIVESDYFFDTSRSQYQHVRKVRWLHTGTWRPRDRPLVTKTLTEITTYAQLVAEIRRAIGIEASDEEIGAEAPVVGAPPVVVYGLDQAVEDLFRPRETIADWLDLALHRRNIVLQGPPGVGKTYLADRLAALIVGRRDPDNVRLVQFHQSYSYEDFVQGYRPAPGGGFTLRDGPFLQFCDRALQDREDRYVLIVDEINRGNVSKILGELMMLIEPDKRDPKWAVTLAYAPEGEKPFYVPPNLYLIGTMNTADRSLAMVDYALRRRFAFIDIEPAVDDSGFDAHLARMGAAPSLVTRIRDRIRRVNEKIEADADLGRGFRIGHSYFCSLARGVACDDRWYGRIVEFEIGPLLREYWFDRPERAEEAEALLLGDE